MKNAYLAICYFCNENCSFCPCSKREKSDKMITPIQELKNAVDTFIEKGIKEVTISGGEPTLHPDFIELIKYLQTKDISITILSNSERFSEKNFIEKLNANVDIRQLRVITTIHSENETEHEKANSTKGSFCRSITGLKNLSNIGAKVIIKHCITMENYQNLVEFYKFVDTTFSELIDVQLCSIDYCGIPTEMLHQEMLSFTALKPFLEQLFDYHIGQKDLKELRKLYCINMPLCSCDVFYWSYLPTKRKQMYSAYKDPHGNQVQSSQNIVGTDGQICSCCKVRDICCGTYKTAFEYFGDKIVKPYV